MPQKPKTGLILCSKKDNVYFKELNYYYSKLATESVFQYKFLHKLQAK